MLTSKTISAKKAKKLARHADGRSEYETYALAARREYDALVKHRMRVTSEKKAADLDEQIKDHMHVNEVRAFIKFHGDPVIARNVTFGKINANGEATRYGFTCVLSKRGDTEVVTVSDSDQLMPFARAKSMVASGALVQAYRACSRRLVVAEMARIEKDKTTAMRQALEMAASIADDTQTGLDVQALLEMMRV
jgi:hypothetical protein